MYIEIRQATSDDSAIIALAVVMAIGEDSAKMYCGEHYMEALQEVAKLKDSQYSYLNALVATVGKVAVNTILILWWLMMKQMAMNFIWIPYVYCRNTDVMG